MSLVRQPAGAELGRALKAQSFRPLPDVNSNGELIGTRLWRTHAGHVEYLALGSNGLAHAVRALAHFDYDHPTDHGALIDHRFGCAANAFDWLIASATMPGPPLGHLYVDSDPPTAWPDPDESWSRST